MRHRNGILAAILTSALIAGGCADMGEEPGGGALRASTQAVSLNAGGQTRVTISGGEPPYVITEAPDSVLASAAFLNPAVSPATLVLTAPTMVNIGGSTRVRIGDVHSEAGTIDAPLHDEDVTITITVSPVPALVAVPASVSVGSGQIVNVAISGGNPPYVVVEAPDSSLATAELVNAGITPATLMITGVTIGTPSGATSIKVKDSSPSPEREVQIPITKVP